MYDLSLFRERVRELCRRASPYDDRRKASLSDLAAAIALSRSEFSARLNGAKGAKLTSRDVRAIVRTLAEWAAITTRAEAGELLAMMDCPSFSAAEWAAPPLDQLAVGEAIGEIEAPAAEPVQAVAQHQPEGNRGTVGRREEVAALAAALIEHPCVAIVGVGGVGKSTLAMMYSAGANFAATCWRNLHHNASFADLVAAALARLGQSFNAQHLPRPAEQANYLVDTLRHLAHRSSSPQRGDLLLILNNFESVIGEDGIEEGWRELLELAVVGGLGRSRLLLTSRERSRSRQGQEPYRFHLGGLSLTDSLALLDRLGVSDEPVALEQAVQQAGGHPLALVFLADLIHNEGYTVGELLRLPVWDERIAELLLDIIYRKLPVTLQQTLQYFSVFEQPVAAATVAGMLSPRSVPPGRGGENWGAVRLRQRAEALAGRSLLESRRGLYQAHPLVRGYAYRLLPQADTYHRASADYFRSLYTRDPHTAPPTSVADVQPLLDAFDHNCRAADYAAAYAILRMPLEYMSGDNWLGLSPLLSRWGEYGRLLTMNQRLSAAPEGTLSDAERGGVLSNLGIVAFNLGEYQRAIGYYQQALELAEQAEDVQRKGRVLGNLGNAYRKLGQPQAAIERYREALAIAEQLQDLPAAGAHWGNLGIAYAELGDYGQAVDCYQQALGFAAQVGDMQSKGAYLSSLGRAYHAQSDYATALDYHRQALALARQVGDQRGQGRAWDNIGEEYEALNQPLDALTCYLKAAAILDPLGPAQSEDVHRNLERIEAATPAANWPALYAAAQDDVAGV